MYRVVRVVSMHAEGGIIVCRVLLKGRPSWRTKAGAQFGFSVVCVRHYETRLTVLHELDFQSTVKVVLKNNFQYLTYVSNDRIKDVGLG